MPDHVHVLVALNPDFSVGELVRTVMVSSAKFINEQHWLAEEFSWQKGFGAFSYSRAQIGVLVHSIQNQKKYHARKSFRDEYVRLLEKFNVDYDPREIVRFGEV